MNRRAGRSPSRADRPRQAPRRPRAESHLRILHRVAETVSRTLDVEDVLRTAVEALTHVTGHEIASLHLLSGDGRTLELRGERGMSARLREVNRALPVGEGLIGRVAAAGRTLQLVRTFEDSRLYTPARAVVREERILGFVCVPIHCRGRVLGTLSLGRKTRHRFDVHEVALVEAAADQIGIALDDARLYSETRRQLEELRRAQEHLLRAERLSAVGELASGVAHEINNPLTTILGQTHLLLTHPEVTPHVRERLGIVADEATRAARIVQSLLLFARRSTPERRPCALADQVWRVLELKSYELRQDSVRVVTEFAPCPAVLTDDGQFRQVLLNLVQNAHQAMLRGAGERLLGVRVWSAGGKAYVEMRDTGPGIPDEILPKIFDPFFTTRPPGEGSGLGLSVSYGIVTDLGGRLRAGNHPEGGAVFVIELPLEDTVA